MRACAQQRLTSACCLWASEQAAGIREDQMVVLPQDIRPSHKTNNDSEEEPQEEIEAHSSIAMLPLMVDNSSKSAPVSLHPARGDSAQSDCLHKVFLTSAPRAPVTNADRQCPYSLACVAVPQCK